MTVVLAGRDYPASGDSGTPIDGVADAGALVFHAGTAERDGRLVTAGGRILAVTGVGPTIEAARDEAYNAAGPDPLRGLPLPPRHRRTGARRCLSRWSESSSAPSPTAPRWRRR